MGNNSAYASFQHTVISLYDRNKLDLELLDILAEVYRGTDIDSGGDTGLMSKDGRDLSSICISLVDPDWQPENPVETDEYDDEWYAKWSSITDGRWGWE